MSEFVFKPATRGPMKLLIGMFGKSGGGKTLSALLVARGIVGPNGKVGLVDTENKRGSVYLDMVPGSFLHLDFQPPFHPLRYCEIIDAAEAQGIDCLCIDSTSGEWSGQGGYLDLKEEALQRMAGDDWSKREKCAMAAAAQVKPKTHSKFVQRVLRCKMSVIMCFRAHEKVRIDRSGGKTEIKVDENPSPMQDNELIYEMMIAGECYSINGVGGYFRVTGPHCKHSHPNILKLLPKEGEQIGMKHGADLMHWCSTGTQPAETAATKTTTSTSDPIKDAKAKLWKLLIDVRGPAQSWIAAEAWMYDNNIIKDGELVSAMDAGQLAEAFDKSQIVLQETKSA